MAFEQSQYERCLTTFQKNSNCYIGDKKDLHYHQKSKLFRSLSTHRATGRDDDRQHPKTYVADETYKNYHVLSEIFPLLQPVRGEKKKGKTTDDNLSLTRDISSLMLLKNRKGWLMLLGQTPLKLPFLKE